MFSRILKVRNYFFFIFQNSSPHRCRGRSRATISPPKKKTYESIFIHHSFVQTGKKYSRYKAVLSPIVTAVLWSILHLPYSSKPLRTDYQILLKSPCLVWQFWQFYWFQPQGPLDMASSHIKQSKTLAWLQHTRGNYTRPNTHEMKLSATWIETGVLTI